MPYLACIPLIIFIISPKGDGAQVYLAIFFILLTSLGIILNESLAGAKVSKNLLKILLFIIILTIFFYVSTILNKEFSIRGLLAPLKFMLFGCIFFSTYVIARKYPIDVMASSLQTIFFAILIFESILICVTVFNPQAFDLIWSSEKTRGAGETVRLPGTLYNPNTLGLVILNFYASIVILSPRILYKRILLTLLCAVLILLSGSRTAVLIFIFFAPFIFFVSDANRNLLFLIKQSLVAIAFFIGTLFYVLYLFHDNFNETFRYVARLRSLDLSSLTALAISIGDESGRYDNWVEKWRYFWEAPGLWKWFLGLGPIDRIKLGDNDFFFSIWNWGIVGSLGGYLLYIFTILLSSVKGTKFRLLLVVIFLQLVVFGLMAETFFSWFHAIVFWVIAGVSLGAKRSNYFSNYLLNAHGLSK
jgi:hypothetical protein